MKTHYLFVLLLSVSSFSFSQNKRIQVANSLPYIVTAQKAYFCVIDTKTKIMRQTQAYLVEGERIVSLKEVEGSVYCSFTNPSTKKTTTGWISKADLEEYKPDKIQINDIDVNSSFNHLKKFDSENQDIKKVYADPTITEILKKIIDADYPSFNKDFLSSPIIGDVYVRHNVLYIKSFVMHNATTNASLFIDLKNGQSFLYWNTFDKSYNNLLKTYGDRPLSSGIINFIQLYKINMRDNIDESDQQLLNNILNSHDSDELVDFAGVESAPEFPKGMVGFSEFLAKNLRYPGLAKKNNITGRVFVTFVVEKDGSITNITITRGLGSGCDEEVIRVMKLSPHWRPGTQGGKKVRTTFTIPVAFSPEEN